ncbi:MAG: hypothetical protein Q4G03_02925 [Planctomycetia bacterium]|nr:hypothetical protein [Planctomycetia bacterium]
MKKTLTQILCLTTISLATSVLITISNAQEPAQDWNDLLTQTEGWLGADGIYTVDLAYDAKRARHGKAPTDANAILFLFSDTFFGSTRQNGREYAEREMTNHSFALLSGDVPARDNMRFFYKTEEPRETTNDAQRYNLIPYRYWLQDAVRYGEEIWFTAILVGKAWKPTRIDAVQVALDKDGLPDFTRITTRQDVRLSHRTRQEQVVFGAAICDDADGNYIYIYGYVDRLNEGSRKDLVVARAPRDTLTDYETWRFYNGRRWVKQIEATLRPEATLVRNVSTEFSISRIPTGRYANHWALVYTPGTISEKVAMRVGQSPLGPFGKELVLYRAPEPKDIRGVKCYNAKAHPALSNDEEVILSYNVNRLGGMANRPEEYRPRFLRLKWRDLEQYDLLDAERDKPNQAQ